MCRAVPGTSLTLLQHSPHGLRVVVVYLFAEEEMKVKLGDFAQGHRAVFDSGALVPSCLLLHNRTE